MALFSRINVTVFSTGVGVAHGLSAGGAALTPDEWHMVPRSVQAAGSAYFFNALPDSVSVYLSVGGITPMNGDLIVRKNHSIIL
jgi:hypothetical protein